MAQTVRKSEAPVAMPRLEILSRCPALSISWRESLKHYKNKSHREKHFRKRNESHGEIHPKLVMAYRTRAIASEEILAFTFPSNDTIF